MLLALPLFLGACGDPPADALRIGLASAPVNLDPRFATDAASADDIPPFSSPASSSSRRSWSSATAVAIAAGFVQVGYSYLRHRKVETMHWIGWLEEEQRHLVWMRAEGRGWRVISQRFGCDRTTAWRRVPDFPVVPEMGAGTNGARSLPADGSG